MGNTKKLMTLCCAVALAFAACSKPEIQYQTFEVTKQDLSKRVEANGSVETENTIDVFAPVSGRLEKLFIKEGDMVRAKQKIAIMSSDTRSTLVDQAQGQSKEEQEYWRTQLRETPIFTPVGGRVISVRVEAGERIGGPIIQVSTGEVIRANLDESDLPSVIVGQNVEVVFDINSQAKLTGKLGKISQISRLVNNVNVYQVEVTLPGDEGRKQMPFPVKFGMTVTLYFRVQEKPGALALPLNAVQGKYGRSVSVLKADNQKVKVKLGEPFGDWVEIISGLENGDKIKIPVFKAQQGKVRKSPLMIKRD